jgi:hypothetical protein
MAARDRAIQDPDEQCQDFGYPAALFLRRDAASLLLNCSKMIPGEQMRKQNLQGKMIRWMRLAI